MLAFEAALREHRAASNRETLERAELEHQYKLVTWHAFRTIYRRAKLPKLAAWDCMLKLRKKDPELAAEVRALFEPLAEAMYERQRAASKAREAELDALAEGYVPRRTAEPVLYRWIYGAAYSSTGRGSHYAHQAAQAEVDHLEAWSIRAEIRTRDSGPEVWAWTDEAGAAAVKRKPGLTIREQVRRCWARGVNPRVYNPFLPHGFEERVGIDYQGRERRTAACTALVPA